MKHNPNFYGLEIQEQLNIQSVKILASKTTIVILPQNLGNSQGYLEFYSCLTHFLQKKHELNSVFGLFLDIFLNPIRKKSKESFFSSFNHENLISILEDDNKEAYYENNKAPTQFLGLELRFEEPISI